MKKLISMLIILVIMLSLSICVFAEGENQTVTIPASMLTEQQKAEIAKQQTASKVQQYGQWVGLGKEIGTAVDSSLGALTLRAEEFANTKVGMFTMAMVAFKVCGYAVIQLIIGIPLLIFMLTFWAISFYRNCIPHRVVKRKEGTFWNRKKEYEIINGNDRYNDKDIEKISHFLVLMALIGLSCAIIFVH